MEVAEDRATAKLERFDANRARPRGLLRQRSVAKSGRQRLLLLNLFDLYLSQKAIVIPPAWLDHPVTFKAARLKGAGAVGYRIGN